MADCHGAPVSEFAPVGTPTIALVGAPNAGKSTLFNALVKADAYVANQLFATLDTTTRQMYLQQVESSVSVSDTVGFIRDLPHKLVEAFEATLQEAADADLLLHVVDAASPLRDEQMHDVERVLAEIGADAVPQVLVFNKLDRIPAEARPRELRDEIDLGGGVRTPCSPSTASTSCSGRWATSRRSSLL